MNVLVIIGNIATDPVSGETRDGTKHTRFRIAVSTGRDTADFYTVKAFARSAEIVSEYAQKGQRVALRGRISATQWEKDGVQHRDVEIIADRVELIGRISAEQNESPQPSSASLDDIPF